MAAQVEEMSSNHSRVLSSGIYQLLLQRRMLDVTITCGGEAIMAHKAVLVSYSKFLDTVFAGQGDDCDVLNMDNLGLEFEAIRAVIFFMYKGVVDTERCGDAAFQQAAKVLCVDVNTQLSTSPVKPEAPAPQPVVMPAPQVARQSAETEPVPSGSSQPSKPLVSKPGKPASKPPTKNKMIDQFTMTEHSRITKLSREVQTDCKITGLPPDADVEGKKKKPKNAYVQTDIGPLKISQDHETITQFVENTSLEKSSESSSDVVTEITHQEPLPADAEKTGSEKVAKKRGRPPKKASLDSGSKQATRKQDVLKDVEPEKEWVTPDNQGNIAGVRTSMRKRKLSAKLKDNLESNDLVQEILKPRELGSLIKLKESPTVTPKRGRGRPRKYPLKETPEQPKNLKASPSEMKKPTVQLTATQEVHQNVHVLTSNVQDQHEAGTDKEGEANETTEDNARDSGCSDEGNPGYPDEKTRFSTLRRIRFMKRRGLSVRAKSDLHSEGKRSLWKRTDDGAYQCLLCDWRRESSRSLTVHLRIHLGEKPFVCDRCNKAFRTTDKLRDHVRTHTGERPFICPVCSRGFSTRKNMSRHKEVHQRDNPLNKFYLCEECGTRFYSVKRLNSHIRRRHGILPKKRIPCQITDCNFTAGDKKTMIYHLAEVHGHALPAELVTVCNVCGASIRKSSLRMHMMIHAAKNIKCEHCNFVTQYTQTLKGHMRRLHGINLDGTPAVRPYACDICPEAYFSRQQLTYHKMRHAGEKPHLCPICNFRTVDKGSMNMHIRTHTGVMPYRCKHCEKSFKQSSALSWHVKTVHMGLRRFTCTECDKHYVNKKDLHAHRFSKHLYVKPFLCSLCAYSCTKKDYMIAHIEKAHGSEHVPEDLKNMKQLLNVVTKFDGGGQSDEEKLVEETSSQCGDSEVAITPLASGEISTIEQNAENIPLLIVSENTLKDLLVPQSSIAVEPKKEDDSSIGEQAHIKQEEVIPKSEGTEDISESLSTVYSEEHLNGTPTVETLTKDSNDVIAAYKMSSAEGDKEEEKPKSSQSGGVWSVVLEDEAERVSEAQAVNESNQPVLTSSNLPAAAIIQPSDVDDVSYQQGASRAEVECQSGEAEIAEPSEEQATNVQDVKQPCYEIQLMSTADQEGLHDKDHPARQEFIEISEDQLQMSEGQFIVVNETDSGEQVIMVTEDKQLILEPGQRLIQAGNDSLIIMSSGEEASTLTTQLEDV